MQVGHVAATLFTLGALALEAAVDVHLIPLLVVEEAVSAVVSRPSDTECKNETP